MKTRHPDGADPEAAGEPSIEARIAIGDVQRDLDAEQTAADADQSASDADQTASDADQGASATDQSSSDTDQRASDRDQATADHDRAEDDSLTPAETKAYDTSRDERETGSAQRLVTRLDRASTARARAETATYRDRIADARDEAARVRDARAEALAHGSVQPDASLILQLEHLATMAAADRARAAADRARAAADRARAATERERLEGELRSAHLDALTGAYRREMGQLALSYEIDRARRSDGRFVVAFVDVDGLKLVNDRDGHAAGDRVLQSVVQAIRLRLRSFDPIIRYGGDEFVCGLAGTDLADAKHRFEAIGIALQADAQVDISVGLAALAAGDTATQLTERADAAMLEVKATHQARQ